MNSKFGQIALSIIFVTLTIQISASAQDTPLQGDTFDKAIGIQFPIIEGWDRGGISRFPVAEMGYSIGYQSGTNAVTFYVFTDGLAKIPNDVNDNIVKVRMRKATNDILKVAELGYYQNLKELTEETVKLGGKKGKVNALHKTFIYNIREDEIFTETYLFVYRDHFVKIRISQPNSGADTENKTLVKFLGEIDTLFSN